ncbi:MAG: hypothetical protein SOZ59_01070 [Candidatus Limivivens sp.]|nr:hypothetical protein [Candidatus Limivivens sp.]
MAEEKENGQIEKIKAIRKQLVSLLSEEEMKEEELIQALQQICPDKSTEELTRACGKMKAGIRNGAAEVRYYTEMGDVDALLQDKIQECTQNMSTAQKKGFLMSLYQILHKDLEYADMTGEMARFLAELPEEEMKEGLYQILYGEACILAVKEMNQFLKAAEEELSGEEPAGNEKWSKEDQWLVTAASIYAASVSGEADGQLALYPEVIGQDVGAQGQAVTEISKASEEGAESVLETIMLVVEILVLLILFYACGFGMIAFAELLYNFLIGEAVSTPMMVLFSLGACVVGTGFATAAVYGAAAALDKLQVFTEEKAVPKARKIFRNIREKLKNRKAEEAEKETPGEEFEEEENWQYENEEREPLWEI